MDWLRALQTFFKVRDIYKKGKTVKKLYDYGKKLDPKKLEWDDLKYFKNKEMEAATKSGRMAEAAADKALSTKIVWPDSGGAGSFTAALKAADKHGAKDARTKSAVQAYRKALTTYEAALLKILSELEGYQSELPNKITLAGALEEYGRVLNSAFMKCAKIPNPTGTAMNAQFFSLAQDAQQFAGIAGSLHTKLKKLKDKNAKAIAEGKELVKTNKMWIQWANSKATASDDALKKNAKNVKPK